MATLGAARKRRLLVLITSMAGVLLCAATFSWVAMRNLAPSGGSSAAISNPGTTADSGAQPVVAPTGPTAEQVAWHIVTMYANDLSDRSRWPEFEGKTVQLAQDPRINVRTAMEFAKRGKPSLVLAQRLKQAEALMSADAVTSFLVSLDERAFRTIAKPDAWVEIQRTSFDSWSRGAGGKKDDEADLDFYRLIERNAETVLIRRVLKYASMIEAAFFATLDDCYPKAEALRNAAREKRIADREEFPTLTAPIFKVQDDLDQYQDKCMYFDNVFVHGNLQNAEDYGLPAGLYQLSITDERGEYFGGTNGLLFACDKKMADALRSAAHANARYPAKIFCQIGRLDSTRGLAEIYRIYIYDRNGTPTYEVTSEHGVRQLNVK